MLFLSLLISGIAFSQQPAVDFSSVDSFAKTVKYRGNLDSLTKRLTDPYSTQLFKTRAIFRWITENIAYDWRHYNRYEYKDREVKGIRCKDDEDCAAKKLAWETNYIDRVVRKKKAVCMGYSMLFTRMCDIAGLRSRVLIGYIRTEDYQVGTPGSLVHAWNAVWIDSTYYLLDATWAAGGCASDDDGKLLFFVKQFKEYYWLTPPEDFVRNHYPQDSIWTLIPKYTKEKFAANPYYDPVELDNVELLEPGSGIIDAKKGDTIRFKIRYQGLIQKLQINSNVFRNPKIYTNVKVRRKTVAILDTTALKMQRYVEFRHNDDVYDFEYVVTDSSLYYLDILFGSDRVMRFHVRIAQ